MWRTLLRHFSLVGPYAAVAVEEMPNPLQELKQRLGSAALLVSGSSCQAVNGYYCRVEEGTMPTIEVCWWCIYF